MKFMLLPFLLLACIISALGFATFRNRYAGKKEIGISEDGRYRYMVDPVFYENLNSNLPKLHKFEEHFSNPVCDDRIRIDIIDPLYDNDCNENEDIVEELKNCSASNFRNQNVYKRQTVQLLNADCNILLDKLINIGKAESEFERYLKNEDVSHMSESQKLANEAFCLKRKYDCRNELITKCDEVVVKFIEKWSELFCVFSLGDDRGDKYTKTEIKSCCRKKSNQLGEKYLKSNLSSVDIASDHYKYCLADQYVDNLKETITKRSNLYWTNKKRINNNYKCFSQDNITTDSYENYNVDSLEDEKQTNDTTNISEYTNSASTNSICVTCYVKNVVTMVYKNIMSLLS